MKRSLSLVLCVLVRKVCDFFMAYMQRQPKNPVDQTEGDLSMRWYNFLIYAGLYILAVYDVFVAFMYFSDGLVIQGIFALLIVVCAIAAKVLLTKRKELGKLMLYITIALNPLLIIADNLFRNGEMQTIMKGGKKSILTIVVWIAVTALIIYANKKYFDKREKLFVK